MCGRSCPQAQRGGAITETVPPGPNGWSYGGMVAQAFASRHPDLTAGLVLEDPSVAEMFVDPAWGSIDWAEGGRTIDKDTTVAELSDLDLGDLPVVVLSSDQLRGRLRRLSYGYHDHLAAATTDGVHVEALGVGHSIHAVAEELVAATVTAVVESVRAGNRSSLATAGSTTSAAAV